MLTIRAHHLFCIPLFKGSGYSEDFVRNMSTIKSRLEMGERFMLICGSDHICKCCPNMTDTGCSLDSNNCAISEKDKLIMSKIGVQNSSATDFSAVYSRLMSQCSEDLFAEICSDCRWYKAGYCNYADLTENIRSSTDK